MFADELHGSQPEQVEVVLGGEPRAEALLVSGSDARSLSLEVVLNQHTHAYLAGHRISGEVVVPVALALEWFSRIAVMFRPDLHLGGIKDLSVVNGIRLKGFEGQGDRLVIVCTQLSNGNGAILSLSIESPTGTVFYRAQADMLPSPRSAKADVAPRLALEHWGSAPIYGDVLFHEDEFQVIQGLDGVSADGISGTLHGVCEAKWGWEQWNTDVAAMDGGLQLLLLWARGKMGGAVLPMGIGEARMSIAEPPPGQIRCVARCRAESKNQGMADVVFLNDAGDLFAELNDVRLIRRPGTSAATVQ
jgi:hypothetical protein